MHSGGMRTARLLTVSHVSAGRGVCIPGGLDPEGGLNLGATGMGGWGDPSTCEQND